MATKDRADGAPKRVRLTAQSKLKRYKSFTKMNWRSKAGINPVVMGWLAKTVNGAAFTHIVIDKLDEEGAELAMRAAYEGEEGAIELKFHPAHRTATVLLSFVTAEWPGYRVEHGRLRSIPVEFRPDETPPYLLLKMKDSTVELAPKKTKSGGEIIAEEQVAAAQLPEEEDDD